MAVVKGIANRNYPMTERYILENYAKCNITGKKTSGLLFLYECHKSVKVSILDLYLTMRFEKLTLKMAI